MLFSAAKKEAIEVVAPGNGLSEARMQELGKLAGTKIDGVVVEQVVVVFVGGVDEANAHLANIKRFGLTCRVFGDDGVERVHYQGPRSSIEENVAPEGPLYPVLREESWPHLATTVHRRLLSGPANVGPWVTFGYDTPKQILRLSPKTLERRTIEEVEAEAVANLAKRNFVPKEIAPKIIGLPGEYCAEAILIPEVMKACAKLIGAQLLCVSMPKENMLVAVDAGDLENVKTVMVNGRAMFDDAKGRRISPLPLLVGDGAPIGFATPAYENDPPAEAKKPWYKFW